MICKQCGEEIEKNSKFCEFCGCKLEEVIEVIDVVKENNLINEQTVEGKIIQAIEEKIELDRVELKEIVEQEKKADNIEDLMDLKQPEKNINKLEEEIEDIEASEDDSKVKRSYRGVIKKIVIAIVIINIIAIGAGVIYLRNINNPQNTVNIFIEALKNSDYDQLTKVAIAKDSNVTLTENSSKALFNLYNNNEVKAAIEETLNEELLKRKSDIPSDNNIIVSLIEEKHGFYSTYKIGIQDYDITVNSSLSNVKIIGFDGEVQMESQEVVIRDVLLGRYNIFGTSIDEYGVEYKYEEYYDVMNNENLELVFKFTDVQIKKPDFEVTNIYVNDKPYSNLAFNGNSLKISPIPYDSTIKIECRTPWGAVVTSDYKVINEAGYNFFEPSFKLDDATRTTLMNLGCEFYQNMYTFYNNRDIASLEKMNYRNDIDVVDSFVNNIDYMSKNKKYGYYENSYTVSNLAADKEFIYEDISLGEFRIYIESTLEKEEVYYNSKGEIEKNMNDSSKNNVGYEFLIKNIDGTWTITDIGYYDRDIKQIYNYN